jgi:hypothetical protein
MAANIDKQIADLKRAMATGVLRAEAPDAVTLTYRDYGEMRLALADLERQKAEQDAATGAIGPRRTRQIVTTGRSGW